MQNQTAAPPLYAVGPTAPRVFVLENKTYTDSVNVARVFSKKHQHVLRDIQQIIKDSKQAEDRSNFGQIFIEDSYGRKQPAYNLTRDGFFFLVMGFTGKNADRLKWAFIAEFNRMEAELKAKALPEPQPYINMEIVADMAAHATADIGRFGHKLGVLERVVESLMPIVGRLMTVVEKGLGNQDALARRVRDLENSPALKPDRYYLPDQPEYVMVRAKHLRGLEMMSTMFLKRMGVPGKDKENFTQATQKQAFWAAYNIFVSILNEKRGIGFIRRLIESRDRGNTCQETGMILSVKESVIKGYSRRLAACGFKWHKNQAPVAFPPEVLQ